MLALTLAITSLAESSWAAFLFFITFDSAWCFTYPLRRNGFVRSRGEGRRGEARVSATTAAASATMPGAGRRGRSLTHPRPGTRSKNSHVKLHQFRPLCGCGFEVYVISPLLEAYSLSHALQFAMVATSAHSLSSSSLGRSVARSRAVRVPPLPFRVCFAPVSETAIDRGRMK